MPAFGTDHKYNGRFKVSFSISGTCLDQLEAYAPDVLESFQELVGTGHVELLNETYAHSLCALKSKSEFKRMVQLHQEKIKTTF
jgi:alpha-amylase